MRLRELPLSYADDAPLLSAAQPPSGYRLLESSRSLGRGRAVLDSASTALMTWAVHERAGFGVTVSSPQIEVGTVLLLRTRVGPWPVTAPCRVVEVVRDADALGFTYGTLPGHPVRGEESFAVRVDDSGEVVAEVRALSRPATLLARLGAPWTDAEQRRIAARYLAALAALAVG